MRIVKGKRLVERLALLEIVQEQLKALRDIFVCQESGNHRQIFIIKNILIR